jgi:hypothetical protein
MDPKPKVEIEEETKVMEEKKEEPKEVKHYILEVQDSIMDSNTVIGE